MSYFRKKLPITALATLLTLFSAGVLFAQIETRSGESITEDGVFEDMVFLAAGDLSVNAKSKDDIFAAGGDVSVMGAQAEQMLVVGGDILFSEVAFQDLITAGGDLTLVSGSVTDDLVAAAGNLDILPEFSIGGSAVLSGGDVTINTPIGGELRVAAGQLTLNADVAGDAHLVGEKVRIGPEVHIRGDLRHRANTIDISPTATVDGEIVALEAPTTPDYEKWGARAAAAAAVFFLAFVIGAAILVVVVSLTLPSLMNGAATMIRTKPFSTLGIGFLTVAAAPAVIALLFASILGIPLALMILSFYLAAFPLALAAFAYFVGMQGRALMSKTATDAPGAGARIIWSALSVGILLVLGLIPFVGGLIWLIAYVIGMGAIVTRGGKALSLNA